MNLLPYTPYDSDPLPRTVRAISFPAAREFVEAHHYMRGMANAATGTYGLFDGPRMVGVLAFATPCSENVRKMVFGPEHCGRVTELHRLVILDDASPVNTGCVHAANTESWFIARALNALKAAKPYLWGVVSFADASAGHVGTIYQATNALYYGPSKGRKSYRDKAGRARSPRQCKVTVTAAEALARGWEVLPASPKHRYCFSLPDDRRHAARLRDMILLEQQDYPKHAVTANRQLCLFGN